MVDNDNDAPSSGSRAGIEKARAASPGGLISSGIQPTGDVSVGGVKVSGGSSSSTTAQKKATQEQIEQAIKQEQRRIAIKKVGPVKRVSTNTLTGEITYIGTTGKKYTFPSSTQVTFSAKESPGGIRTTETDILVKEGGIVKKYSPEAFEQKYQKEGESKIIQTLEKQTIPKQIIPTKQERVYDIIRKQEELKAKKEGRSPRKIFVGETGEQIALIPKSAKIDKYSFPSIEQFRKDQAKGLTKLEKERSLSSRYEQYKTIGKKGLENKFINLITTKTISAAKKTKQFYKKESTQTFLKTSKDVAMIPIDIYKGTKRDIKSSIEKSPELKSIYEGSKSFVYPYTATKKVLTGIGKKLPSSEKLKDYFISGSEYDIKKYSKKQDFFSKSRVKLAQTNILATNILSGAYEYSRTKPGEIMDIGVTSYGLGGVLGVLSKGKKVRTAIQVGGGIAGTAYVGSVGIQTLAEPSSKRGTILGEEIVKSTSFMAGFSKGYKDFFKPVELELIQKGGLEYKGSSYFEQKPKTKRYGIIKEQYPEITRIESSGIIRGKGQGRIKGIEGSFTEDVSKGIIFEDRIIDYEGLLFKKKFLVKETIKLGQGTTDVKLIKLGTKPTTNKLLFQQTAKIPPTYASPITAGAEIIETRQIKSFTPERARELYNVDLYGAAPKSKPGDLISLQYPKLQKSNVIDLFKTGTEIRSQKIQTGVQQDLLRRLNIVQERKISTAEIAPSAIITSKGIVKIDLMARQTKPQKTSLSIIKSFEPKSQELAEAGMLGIEPFTKVKVNEETQFRELYFGTEKFESRKAKYDRLLYPSEVKGSLEKKPTLVKLPQFSPKTTFFKETNFAEDLLYKNLQTYSNLRKKFDKSDLKVIQSQLFEQTKTVTRKYQKSPFLDFIGKGKPSNVLLKKYDVKFEPTSYFGLEKQFTPAKITKQQKIKIFEDFDIYVPTKKEKSVILESIFSTEKKIGKQQKLYEDYLTKKYTTKELLKEMSSARVPVIDKKGRVLTPNYLKELNLKARKKIIKENKKYFDYLSSTYKQARKQTEKEFPDLAMEVKIGVSKDKTFQTLVEKRAEQIRKKGKGISISDLKIKQQELGKSAQIIGSSVEKVTLKSKPPKILSLFGKSKQTQKEEIKIKEKLSQPLKIKIISKIETKPKLNINAQLSNRLKENLRMQNKIESELRSNINLKSNLRSNLESNIKTNLESNLRSNIRQELRQEQELKTPLLIRTSQPKGFTFLTSKFPELIIPPTIEPRREGIYAYQLFDVKIKRYGKDITVAERLPKGRALKTLSESLIGGLGASGKLFERGIGESRKRDISFTPSAALFRQYRIVKGKRVPIKDELIQRRGTRLSSLSERIEIQEERRKKSKQRRKMFL